MRGTNPRFDRNDYPQFRLRTDLDDNGLVTVAKPSSTEEPAILWFPDNISSSGFTYTSLSALLWEKGSLRPWESGKTAIFVFGSQTRLLRSYPTPTYSCGTKTGEYQRHDWEPGPFGVEAKTTPFTFDTAGLRQQPSYAQQLNIDFDTSCVPLANVPRLTEARGWNGFGTPLDPEVTCGVLTPPTAPKMLTLKGERVEIWAIGVSGRIVLRYADGETLSFVGGSGQISSWGPPGKELLTVVKQTGLDLFDVTRCRVSRINGPGRFYRITAVSEPLGTNLWGPSGRIWWHCVPRSTMVMATKSVGEPKISWWRLDGNRLQQSFGSPKPEVALETTTCSNDG